MTGKLPNIHPGEILLEEFLVPLGISQNRLARDINVPPRRINEIVLGKRAVTADTAVRLARYFGITEQFWMGLQGDYELEEVHAVIGSRDYAERKGLSLAEAERWLAPNLGYEA